ncbi:MAG: hypothetical protein Q8P59_09140, partial [Dehalococcoidia bacterium]|nr:hypothetical protein [Dehalococcoidia bacterium]
FLAFELLLEADACYMRFDYRLCVLFSSLAIDVSLYEVLKKVLQQEVAIKTLSDSTVLGKQGIEELKKQLATGILSKARQWIFKWLEQDATLGALVQAAKALDLEGNLQKGILNEIGELNKKRNKLVHPRGWIEVEQGDAHRARSLARRFLQLSGQLSG